MGIQAAPANKALPEGTAAGVMDHLNWGYIQLGLVAQVFGGLQVWWISSVFWKRDLARAQSGGEFRKSLERNKSSEQVKPITVDGKTCVAEKRSKA